MAIYARLENGTYAEVTGVYKTDGTEVTEIFQGDRLVYSATNEIYGTVPLYYDGLGYELIDYVVYGNAVQDGTPSSDAPVDVVGCGVRTENLFNRAGEISSYYINSSGKIIAVSWSVWFVSDFTQVQPNSTYTFTYNSAPGVAAYHAFYDADKEPISTLSMETHTFTTPNNARYMRFSYRDGSYNIMLNSGSTALPYEPYGYKLPPTVNGTEYPIYLGQVESTRRIKKLVLSGEDGTWQKSNTRTGSFFLRLGNVAIPGFGLCDRAVNAQNAGEYSSSGKMLIERSGSNILINMWLFDTDISVDDFKSYLAAQYAAGTPVTVWYVLAEPETAVVNEPLMKIGDYADTISAEQAGVTIPTVSGANVLDMASTVKPSEVCIKGKGIKQNRGQS